MAKQERELVIGQDVRADRVGFVNELKKRYADPIDDQLKASMLDRKLDLAQAEFFEGLLSRSTPRKIDVHKFLDLLFAGVIKREQAEAALSVKVDAAEKLLAADDFAGIVSFEPEKISLTVKRKKGIEIAIVDAVKAVGEAIAARK